MPSEHFHFTKRAIERIEIPERLITYHDTQTRGLKLVARPTGRKIFLLYRKVNGHPERFTIGHFPDITLEQARIKVAEMNAHIAQGRHPKSIRAERKHEMTLGECFEQFMERHAKIHKKSWKGDQDRFQRELTMWRKRPLSDIHRNDIQTLHNQIGTERSIYAANHLLALLKTLFNKAIEWGWEHPNPTKGIKKFKEKSRERFLQADELPRFFEALALEENGTARDFIFMCLFTGARRGNVRSMRWEHVFLTRGTWEIPETKNGESHTLPLVPEAVSLLKERFKNRTEDCPWVFPGTGKSGHLYETRKAWSRVLLRAELKNLRLHDLRRSMGSWQAATGASLSIIGKTLAHKHTATTAIYARLNLDPVRAAMEKATRAMFAAAHQDQSGTKDPISVEEAMTRDESTNPA